MPRTHTFAGAVALILLGRPGAGAALPFALQRPAVVRVSVAARPPAAKSNRSLLEMMREAEAIWHPYGVRLVWSAPWTVGPDSPADVAIRVEFVPHARVAVDGRPQRVDATALGVIRFDEADRPDNVIRLSAPDVESIVLTTRWGGTVPDHLPDAVLEEMIGRALGRVLAHELGHYLLALRTHTATGLMRSRYPGPELAGWDRHGFRLDSCALERLRARLGGLKTGATAGMATALSCP